MQGGDRNKDGDHYDAVVPHIRDPIVSQAEIRRRAQPRAHKEDLQMQESEDREAREAQVIS